MVGYRLHWSPLPSKSITLLSSTLDDSSYNGTLEQIMRFINPAGDCEKHRVLLTNEMIGQEEFLSLKPALKPDSITRSILQSNASHSFSLNFQRIVRIQLNNSTQQKEIIPIGIGKTLIYRDDRD